MSVLYEYARSVFPNTQRLPIQCLIHDVQPHEVNDWPSRVIEEDLEILNRKWQQSVFFLPTSQQLG